MTVNENKFSVEMVATVIFVFHSFEAVDEKLWVHANLHGNVSYIGQINIFNKDDFVRQVANNSLVFLAVKVVLKRWTQPYKTRVGSALKHLIVLFSTVIVLFSATMPN